jgi:hypothetical protein
MASTAEAETWSRQFPAFTFVKRALTPQAGLHCDWNNLNGLYLQLPKSYYIIAMIPLNSPRMFSLLFCICFMLSGVVGEDKDCTLTTDDKYFDLSPLSST